MKRIFIDTNILLDVFLEREPFVNVAQSLWTLSERGKLQAAISALSVSNIFYIVSKLSSEKKAYIAVEALTKSFKIIEVSAQMIQNALKERFTDFEDGIQYQCALKFKAKAIISRDAKGFSKSLLPVIDGSQFLI